MSRVDEDGTGTATTGTSITHNLTISGVDRFTLVWQVLDAAGAGNEVQTITYGGTTVYELGGDETAEVFTTDVNADSYDVFRFFDGDHPSNGATTVVVTANLTQEMVGIAVQYDDAEQTDGFRDFAQSVEVSVAANPWDITGIGEDGADQETVGFFGTGHASRVQASDADNPEIVSETIGGSGGTALTTVAVADTTSQATLGGDWSGTAPRTGVGWGASIMNAVSADLPRDLAHTPQHQAIMAR